MLKPTTCLALGLTLILSSVARAEHIVDAHIKAIGGADAIAKIKTIRRTGKTEMKGLPAQGTIEQACVVGKKALQVLDLGAYKQVLAWNGEDAWAMDSITGSKEATEQQLQQLRGIAAVNPIVGIKGENGASAFESWGEQEFEGAACEAFKVTGELTIYIDKNSKMFAGMTTKVNDPLLGGETTIKITYSDFAKHRGVMFPEKSTINIGDGALMITFEYTNTEINGKLDDSKFEKP